MLQLRDDISCYKDSDDKVFMFAFFSLAYQKAGQHALPYRVIVQVEKLANDLFVTHECPVNCMQASLPCWHTQKALQLYLSITNERYEDIVYENRRVLLSPNMILLKEGDLNGIT
ncbi:hypothetical protein M3202_19715 [Alkalihalobacillus oceani]|uniref:Uncharacterized protein n=1 Tax=Halalkalibacter oceani TaxID=1653776 RepID=A0A9X2DVQ3_9BACI|nr:hypothetical protein [Halalkalibacter oceani]MCM3716275.1 hypothetical protein [Halalkalibacter oceani]